MLRRLMRLPPAWLHDLLDRFSPCPGGDEAAALLAAKDTFYVAIDETGTVHAWNAAAEQLFGYPAAAALGRQLDALIIPAASRAAHSAGMERFRQTGHGRGIGSMVEVDALRADGSTVPVELSITARRGPHGWVFHALGHDLTHRRRSQRLLEILAAHRRGLLHTDEPTAARALLCDTVREAVQCQGVYLYEPTAVRSAAPQGAQTFRLMAESLELAGSARGEDLVLADVAHHLGDSPGQPLRFEQLSDLPGSRALLATGLQRFLVRPLCRNGELVGVLLLGWLTAAPSRTEPDTDLLDLLGNEAVLVFERLSAQQQLEDAARRDSLTGLANRRAFDEQLPADVAVAEEDGDPLTLVVLDLDRFKAYNDSFGHPAGDALLVEAARAWRSVVRDAHLARTGGDEFALLLPGQPAEAAEELVARLREVTPAQVGVTHGLAQHLPGGSAEDLLRRADADLYARKRGRR